MPNRTRQPGRFKRSSIRARLFIAIGVPTVILVVGLSVLAWLGARREVQQSLSRELTTIAEVAANSIHPQTPRFMTPGAEGSRTYKGLMVKTKAIQNASGSVRVLLIGADEKVRFDASEKIPIMESAPRLALDRTEFKAAIATGKGQVSVPYEGKDGVRYLAAYARLPEKANLIDDGEENNMPIVLAIEAPTQALDATDRLASYLMGLGVLAILFVFAIAAWVANSITSPLTGLAKEAAQLAQGDLDKILEVPEGDDEVSLLGHTLENMRLALKSRDQERQMMLAGIAHEVRNPLGGMELFGGLLEEAIGELHVGDAVSVENKSELSSHAQRVRRELRYLTGVVNDFLAFARELPAARDMVALAPLVSEVRSLTAGDADVLVVDLNDAPKEFALDRGRIKEALINLVENAKQASEPGGQVLLRAFLDDEALVFEVQDKGRGIGANTLENVFTPFFTTREKGSGLGLPLVKKFARDHGGDATMTSVLGEGTTVRLRLAKASKEVTTGEESEPLLLGDSDSMLSGEGAPVSEGLLGDG